MNMKQEDSKIVENNNENNIAEDMVEIESALLDEQKIQENEEIIKKLNDDILNNKQILEEQNNAKEKINKEIENLKIQKEETERLIQEANIESKKIIDRTKEHATNLIEGIDSYINKVKDNFIKETGEKLDEIYEKTKTLNSRELDIQSREVNAQKGFVTENAKNIKIKGDLEKENIKKKIEIDKELAKYREEQYLELNNEINKIRKTIKSEQESLEHIINDLVKRETAIQKTEAENLAKEEYLNKKEIYIKTKEKSIDSIIENKMKEEVASRAQELQEKKDILNKTVKENTRLRAENAQYIIAHQHYSKAIDLEGENESLKNQVEYLSDQLKKYRDNKSALTIDIKKKAQLYDELYNEYVTIKEQNVELRQIQTINVERENENNFLKDRLKQNKITINSLEEEIDKREIVTREERISAITKSIHDFENLEGLYPFSNDMTEEAWLNQIKEKSIQSGIVFSDRLLKAYHTSVKIGDWSPIVVLAGVSGTGKSELPRQYALHGGINFLSIAVKPDWDSPQSLFGYYNSIENKFEPTKLLRALYQMQHDDNKKDQLLMVLLDEMNLAHVELYFSDLLSNFETKRGTNSNVEYEISLGAGVSSEILSIASNILWTGTMNEDETTKALSDKVVDRSTLITFPRPKNLIGRSRCKNVETEKYLPKQLWDKWLKSALSIDNEKVKNILDSYKVTTEEINNAMSKLGRNLGHRVWQSIQYYIVNHPDVISRKDDLKLQDAMDKAFSEAVAFKIMPKLRGVETSGEFEDIIDEIRKIIEDKIPDLIEDFNQAKNLPTKIFMWHTAEFLDK